ncbi:hypothetical protein OU415_00350 [Saccharopolyspora sp. WRP15-2]|uniref:Uncharacterized protein n=1 Tax=Saccharopolyspora oryzae TaxID=2997343 RepID=A0ABT4UQ57_9PSEU|nr:hypothetical protein [Saccharopolyspora oryzae]MDA3623860.1 hypothetical protein [Saccharopolyspora oryzae]
MWCNVRLIGLVWTGEITTESTSENWYTQALLVSLVGAGWFFGLALLCGKPGSTRSGRQRKHCPTTIRGAEDGWPLPR